MSALYAYENKISIYKKTNLPWIAFCFERFRSKFHTKPRFGKD